MQIKFSVASLIACLALASAAPANAVHSDAANALAPRANCVVKGAIVSHWYEWGYERYRYCFTSTSDKYNQDDLENDQTMKIDINTGYSSGSSGHCAPLNHNKQGPWWDSDRKMFCLDASEAKGIDRGIAGCNLDWAMKDWNNNRDRNLGCDIEADYSGAD